MLIEAGKDRTFEQLLRYYYSITKEDPPDLAVNWIAHALAEVSIAEFVLRQARLPAVAGPLLDLGCSTGALLIAARGLTVASTRALKAAEARDAAAVFEAGGEIYNACSTCHARYATHLNQ